MPRVGEHDAGHGASLLQGEERKFLSMRVTDAAAHDPSPALLICKPGVKEQIGAGSCTATCVWIHRAQHRPYFQNQSSAADAQPTAAPSSRGSPRSTLRALPASLREARRVLPTAVPRSSSSVISLCTDIQELPYSSVLFRRARDNRAIRLENACCEFGKKRPIRIWLFTTTSFMHAGIQNEKGRADARRFARCVPSPGSLTDHGPDSIWLRYSTT